MKKSTKSIMASLALAAIAIPGTIAADSLDAFASAELETEQQNLAWYTDLDTDVAQNESCREDLVEPVFVPEYDGRVIVKGEIASAGLISCVDIQLQSDAPIHGAIWAEARMSAFDWRPFYSRDIRGNMTRGVGVEEGVVDYVFPANSAYVGKPLRVCIQTYTPDPSPVLCKTAKTAASAQIVAPLS